jgi:hypothetical protein
VLSDGDGNPRVVVNSFGSLFVGKTASATDTTGIQLNNDGQIVITRESNVPVLINRETDFGEIVNFRIDNALHGNIAVVSPNDLQIVGSADHSGIQFASRAFLPLLRNSGNTANSSADDAIDLGSGSVRFDDVFATNGTIQTSDRNEKQDIEQLSDAETRVAVVAKGLMRKFRWIDSVAEKGDNARTHFGIIAQDLQDAFTAEGLDASDYAMFTSNTWWQKEISVDAVEADEENDIEAQDAYTYMDTKDEATEGYTEKTRLGVRYNQLLAFIISAI